MAQPDSTDRYELAIKDIQEVLFGCLVCGAWVTDGTSVAGKSGADAISEIEHILQRHGLTPTDEQHDEACDYASSEDTADEQA